MQIWQIPSIQAGVWQKDFQKEKKKGFFVQTTYHGIIIATLSHRNEDSIQGIEGILGSNPQMLSLY